jgi:hypothetical protein
VSEKIIRIGHQIARARLAGLPHTLTVEQWKKTLAHFQERCAYCGWYYDVLEHFIPLIWKGGTVYSNCVPACNTCNVCKDHPTRLLLGDRQKSLAALLRVQAYLQSIAPSEFNEELATAYIDYQRERVPIIYPRKSKKERL